MVNTRFVVKILLILSLITLFVVCSPSIDADSGNISEEVSWTYESGTLTVSGTGNIGNGRYFSEYCGTTEKLIIEEGIISIGDFNFNDFRNLKDLSLPNTLVKISKEAFSFCFSLERIVLPASLKELGQYAFNSCANVRALEFLGNGLTAIPDNCFTNLGQRHGNLSLVIPEGVTTIGRAAFSGSGVSSLILAESVKSLGRAAFAHTPLEGELDLSNVEIIGIDCFSAYGAWSHPSYITSVIFSVNLKSIDASAFMDCDSLSSVTIPKSVESVGRGAFSHCDALQYVLVLSNDANLGLFSFAYCSSLEFVEIHCREIGTQVFQCDYALKEVVLESTEILGERCFYQCSGLEDVYLSSELYEIGAYCFAGTTSLKCIHVPDDNEHFDSDGSSLLFNNGSELITYFKGLDDTSYTIPDSVRIIWDGSFTDLVCLEYIMFGKNMTASDICYEQFSGCTSLAYMDVSKDNRTIASVNGVIYSYDKTILIYAPLAIEKFSLDVHTELIKSRAFYECSKLRAVKFSSNVSGIGDSAFYGCTSLTTVNIQSVSSIAAKAFHGCPSITKVIITETGDISFGKDCFDTGSESLIIGSNFEDGFLDKYIGKSEATYVTLEMDTRSDIEKVKGNTPLIVGAIVLMSILLIGGEVLFRRRH